MISNKGFMESVLTMKCECELYKGCPVTFSGNNGAFMGLSNGQFLGIALNQTGEIAAIQVKGYAKVQAEGNMHPGILRVICNGYGGITPDENGREIICISFDSASGIAEIIM